MENRILFRAGLKRHRGGLLGIFALLLIVSLSLSALLSVWSNGNRYLRTEMGRLGYGDLTAWVSGVPNTAVLATELTALPQVTQVGIQPLLFSNYRIGEQESDSEGQLIGYDPQNTPYYIFTDDLSHYQTEPTEIAPGEIYVSPSLASMFGIKLGDEIAFPTIRGSDVQTFIVSGWFEDPFMGSSMIGMKSFLIGTQDLSALTIAAENAGIDALARGGAMLHIFGTGADDAELGSALNGSSRLPEYAEFTHSAAAISGFMLVLQNAFIGFLLAFVTVLIVVSIVILGHSIGSSIEQDYANIGILKSMGFTATKLRQVQLAQYILPILGGMIIGIIGSIPLTVAVNRGLITTTGLLLPNRLPIGLCTLAFAGILCLLTIFILLKTSAVNRITPLQAIRGADAKTGRYSFTPIYRRGLPFWMALRQLATGKRQYVSVCVVAVLLVFFASMMGRMDAWLGPNGQGMMNAFNSADLDIAVQPLGEVAMRDVEEVIFGISPVVDSYELAMPSVVANGMDYTANVITEPERFHLLSGHTSVTEDEVVLTESVASDLGVTVGEVVTLSAGVGSGVFTVSGIYQCANSMGANLGLSPEGYARIGTLDPQMWCKHYFLEDPARQPDVIAELNIAFGHDLHIHENTWPGLQGIIVAMRGLLTLMYAVVAVFILIVTTLVGSKLLAKEQKDFGVYKALGFSATQLRFAFVLRFGVVSLFGASVGVLTSNLLTDPLVASVMRLCGISNFSSHPRMASVLLPAVIVICLFMGISYLSADRIKHVSLTTLIKEY